MIISAHAQIPYFTEKMFQEVEISRRNVYTACQPRFHPTFAQVGVNKYNFINILISSYVNENAQMRSVIFLNTFIIFLFDSRGH